MAVKEIQDGACRMICQAVHDEASATVAQERPPGKRCRLHPSPIPAAKHQAILSKIDTVQGARGTGAGKGRRVDFLVTMSVQNRPRPQSCRLFLLTAQRVSIFLRSYNWNLTRYLSRICATS